jgi:phosphoribosylformylglycinamidine synthase
LPPGAALKLRSQVGTARGGLRSAALAAGEARHAQHDPCDNQISVKAQVSVYYKSTVLDPQGKTVCAALRGLGHRAVSDVRQGKIFEIQIAEGVSREEARKEIETISQEILANPVIEEYRVEIID